MSDPTPPATNGRIEILLVEDDPADVRLIETFLTQKKPNYHLNVVSTGEEAIAYLFQKDPYPHALRPDLILLDLNLPLVDGRDALSWIKSDRNLKCIPVVILSSSNAPHDISRTYDLHANAYIVKPATLDEFEQAMKLIEEFWLKTVKLPTRFKRP